MDKKRKEMSMKGIGCPSCGGSLEVQEGMLIFKCQYCTTTLRLQGDRNILRYVVRSEVGKETTRKEFFRWASGGFRKAPDLKREAKITEEFSIYIPFWRAIGWVAGYVCGREVRYETVGSGKYRRTVRREYPVEREVNMREEFIAPACDVGEFGVERCDLEGDTILPFEINRVQRSGMVFEPTNSEKEAFEIARGKFISEGQSSAGVDIITFSHVDVIKMFLYLIYYPFNVVRYEYKGRRYTFVLDGESGKVGYAKAPGNDFYRALMLSLLTLIGTVLIAVGLSVGFGGLIFSSDADIGGGGIVVGILIICGGFAVCTQGYRILRYGGEVEEGICRIKKPFFKKFWKRWKFRL